MGTFGSICRLCCGEENNLIQIFSCYDLRMQLADKIKKYLDVEIHESDSLPKNVCSGCLVKLKDVEEFVELTKKAQRTLTEHYLHTLEARQRAERGSVFNGGENSSNFITRLLLQDELKRVHSTTGLGLFSCRAALSTSERNAGSQRRKGQKKPIKAIRKNLLVLSNDINGTFQQYSTVKNEPDDQYSTSGNSSPAQEVQEIIESCKEIESMDTSSFSLFVEQQQDKEAEVNDRERKDSFATSNLLSVSSVEDSPDPFTDGNTSKAELRDSCENNNGKPEYNNNSSTNNNNNHNDPAEDPASPAARHNGDGKEFDLDLVPEPLVKVENEVSEEGPSLSGDERDPNIILKIKTSKIASNFKANAHVGRCSLCEAPFYALSSLLLHINMQHSQEPKPQNPLMCLFCNLTYRDLNKLSEHTSLKHADGGSQESPSSSAGVDGAVAVKARAKQRSTQTCAECNKGFPSKRGLLMHQKVHSKNQKAAKLFKTKVKQARKKVQSSVRCSICGESASSFPQLKAHVAAEHPDTDCNTPYMCDQCTKSYSAPASLVHHKAKHGVDAINCPVCSKSYHPKYLKKHMVVHQEHRPYKCDQCEKTFKDPEGLRHHGLKHKPDDQKYKCSCPVCGQRFMNNGSMNVHIKVVHEQVKDYSCQFCDRKFGSKSTAEIHERTHTGERPFCCELCDWRCNSKGKLKVHMRVHSNVKPFECQSCGKRTKSKNEMRQHELIHTDKRPYPCRFCEKRFRSTSQLKIHERQHTGERPYRCPHCTRNFCDFANYSKHMHRVHKKEFEISEDKMLYKGVPGKDLASAGKMLGPAHVNPDIMVEKGIVAEKAKETSAVSSAVSQTNQVSIALTDATSKNSNTTNNSGSNVSGVLSSLMNENNDGNAGRTSTNGADMYTFPAALQLLRPSNSQQQQQNQLLQQLHSQQQQHQQQHQQNQHQHLQASSDSSFNSAASNMHSVSLSHHHTPAAVPHAAHQHQQSLMLQIAHNNPHQQQLQQQHSQHHQQPQLKSHQQQLIEHLLPLNLPPPPQAHQRLPHSLLHSSHHLALPSSSLLSSLTSAATSSSSSSAAAATPLHHHQTQAHQQQSANSSVYSNSQQQVSNMASQLPLHVQHQLSHHQGGQQQQLLQQQQQQQQQHHQYQNLASFSGSHLSNLSSSTYDSFRLPL